MKRRKSIASSIHPSCAGKRARHALRSTAMTDIGAQYGQKNRRARGPAVSFVLRPARRRLEGDLRAETPHAGRLELGDAITGAGAAVGGHVEQRVALQDGALVRGVEEVCRDRQTDAVEE